jgi:hypothetical protein
MGKLHRILLGLMLALVALTFAKPALAQSFPKPPDVPAYVTVTPTYASGTTLNKIGNGIGNGGVAPAAAYELTEVAPVSESGWTVAGGADCVTTLDGGSCHEAKFRTRTSGDVKILWDDPIRNYGMPGTSHCHTFFGNMSANAYSTYATLRNRARGKSLAAGGPLNGTAYWFPCVIKNNAFGDGKNYVLKPSDSIIIYYQNPPDESFNISRLFLGLRYVGGYDMDTGQTFLQDLVATANAQPGTANRYRVCQNPGGAGEGNWSAKDNCGSYVRWTCVANDGSGELTADSFVGPGNTDPFNGKCTAGQDFWMQFKGPSCWDGKNYWSPGGYKHVIPHIWDTVEGKFVCPTGWYRLPALAFQIHFAHQGWSDYSTWVLSSDASAGTLPGGSFHTDWFNGWDRTALTSWLTKCIGIGTEAGSIVRECDGSSIGGNLKLLTNEVQGAPTGRAIQTGTYFPGVTTSASGMFQIPATHSGPKTLHIHGVAANGDPEGPALMLAENRKWELAGAPAGSN